MKPYLLKHIRCVRVVGEEHKWFAWWPVASPSPPPLAKVVGRGVTPLDARDEFVREAAMVGFMPTEGYESLICGCGLCDRQSYRNLQAAFQQAVRLGILS